MSIFKAYDIRGKYPGELNEKKATAIGWAYVKFLQRKIKSRKTLNIVVGRDVRLSSSALSDKLIDGMIAAGARITDIGEVTTPMSYFANGFYHFDGSVMVTASHNPPEYNGFKVCREKAIAFSETTGLKEIELLSGNYQAGPGMSRGRTLCSFRAKSVRKKAKTKKLDISSVYKNFIRGFIKFDCAAGTAKKIRVAVDTTNGNVGPVFQEIFKNVPVLEIFPLYFKPDGRFPNHQPNPMKDENVEDLKKLVKKRKADLGVAFDGDGDRVVFLDEKGKRIANDLISALITREILRENKKASIIYDLRSSRVVKEEIKKLGGRPVRERVGHAFIKATMRKYNAPFGGELSGHYYYRDNYFADSALITFVHVLNIISRHPKPISWIIKPLQKYFSSGEINFEVHNKEAKMNEVARKFSSGKIDYLDGVTVEFKDWWLNLRPSNTEPLLRLNIEAGSSKQLRWAKKTIGQILTSV